MAMRTCTRCGAAENPLGRLRFRKSNIDGKIYCDNCGKGQVQVQDDPAPAPHLPRHKPSAGYVVVSCPDCAGGIHRPHNKPCSGCSGYGAVRIEASALNVYKPPRVPAPQVLNEG